MKQAKKIFRHQIQVSRGKRKPTFPCPYKNQIPHSITSTDCVFPHTSSSLRIFTVYRDFKTKRSTFPHKYILKLIYIYFLHNTNMKNSVIKHFQQLAADFSVSILSQMVSQLLPCCQRSKSRQPKY